MADTLPAACPDPRNLRTGGEIPTESYSDQPYVVQTDDGAWLCCVTTGPGHEGARGQHVATMRSADLGRTWSVPLAVEPADSPENSYAVMLKLPSGRVCIFYNHNSDNVREVQRHDGQGSFARVDSLGHFVCKYSDDHGRSWSARRYELPVRLFQCDRDNVYGGALRFFWNVGRPFVHAGSAYVPHIKVGQMGEGFFQQSEGVLLKSDNLLTEPDPARWRWETLPDGEIGLRTPAGGGPISEEQSYCVLSDGTFYVVYRSIDGHPVEAYSRDGGHTWTPPRYKRYANGHPMKHPRAANFVWKCSNGKYLYWFHNHGGKDYEDRNPVWLSGGVEIETPNGREIAWSQPEIALYDDDPYIRISYPDLIEQDGTSFLTETQKDLARLHRLDPELLGGLWGQFEPAVGATPAGLLREWRRAAGPADFAAPPLPLLLERDHARLDYGTKDRRAGFSLELWLDLPDAGTSQVLLDGRVSTGMGLALLTTPAGTVELVLNDGRSENRWACTTGLLRSGVRQHLVVIVDGGPKLILFVANGMLDDGGDRRQFGWGRFSPNLRQANGSQSWRLAPAVHSLRVYGRALRVSEAIANGRAVVTGEGEA